MPENTRDFVECPVCGHPHTCVDINEYDDWVVHCTNQACASNGGHDYSNLTETVGRDTAQRARRVEELEMALIRSTDEASMLRRRLGAFSAPSLCSAHLVPDASCRRCNPTIQLQETLDRERAENARRIWHTPPGPQQEGMSWRTMYELASLSGEALTERCGRLHAILRRAADTLRYFFMGRGVHEPLSSLLAAVEAELTVESSNVWSDARLVPTPPPTELLPDGSISSVLPGGIRVRTNTAGRILDITPAAMTDDTGRILSGIAPPTPPAPPTPAEVPDEEEI